MKRAFTLIELLVVIAIIAILAAILFPVFAQAKLAAKKTAGLSQAKQIGTAVQIYLADYDDVLCGYRWSVSNSLPPINSYYLSLGASDPKKATLDACGLTTIHAEFFNRLIQPYHKNDELFRSPGYPNAWVNFQDKNLIGTCQGADTNFHSYGGQDSIAANNYLMRANAGTPMSKVAEVSNTLMFVDATYYNSLPAQPLSGFCKIDGYAPNPTTYSHYWKHLGNNLHNFNSPGNPDPDDPSNATVWSNINARYSGVLNVIMCDTSSKSRPTKDVVYNLRQKLDQSYWNPLKTACEP